MMAVLSRAGLAEAMHPGCPARRSERGAVHPPGIGAIAFALVFGLFNLIYGI